MSIALVMLTVTVGAAAQRITGMGFAVLSAPFLILVVGGFEGVLMVNLCAVFTSAVILTRVWRDVQWRRWRLLVAGATVGIVPGIWVVTAVPEGWLEMTVGLLVIAGLIAARLVRQHGSGEGHWAVMATGAISGVMNTSAGIGGAALSVYAVAVAWERRSLVATVQPYFLAIGAISLTAMLAIQDMTGTVDPRLWALVLTACAIGLLIGEWLSTRVSALVSYQLLIVLALLGALAAATRGGLTITGVTT